MKNIQAIGSIFFDIVLILKYHVFFGDSTRILFLGDTKALARNVTLCVALSWGKYSVTLEAMWYMLNDELHYDDFLSSSWKFSIFFSIWIFRLDDKMFIPIQIIRSRANITTVFSKNNMVEEFTGFRHAFEFSTRCVCET